MDKYPEIIYEDNHVIVAVKPAGILSQADSTGDPDMLTLLKQYIAEKYNKPGNVFLGLVHRLDRPVEGLMVFARTSKAASRISSQIREHDLTKKYRAVVTGTFKIPEGTLTDTLLKDPGSNTVRVVKEGTPGARKSVLEYRVTDSKQGMSLVDINLLTGRSHQIRVQLSNVGCPIVGDTKYGGTKIRGDLCLQSYVIGFNHPTRGEYMEFTLPLGTKSPWSLFDH